MSRSIMSSDRLIELELQEMIDTYQFVRPDRGNLDAQPAPWRHVKPDYRKADLAFFKGKTMNHKPGSLEMIVENLVKTWEMEASHLPDYKTWSSIDADCYQFEVNGKHFEGKKATMMGNYNTLLSVTSKELYDSDHHTFESSHDVFRGAFPNGFPWEVLHVFSGPPRVAFSWRHWATFDGSYKENVGEGQLVEMHGFLVATVNENLKICKLEVFYKPDEFIKALEGQIPASDLARGQEILGSGCPVHKGGGEFLNGNK
ncbi:pathogen-related protein-like [Asterias rubens]|uniref:pathogen-related protein-like n=1 Tax=Asterias rubens TaxID=7604 RepID=UPI001455220E|nr:pathogen-related protein-like [Asterias rubens]